MGTNSAPEIANLTCYVDEQDEMNQLISAGKIDEAKKHADNFRHIDDILGWNIKPPLPERYGLQRNGRKLQYQMGQLCILEQS